MFHYERNEKTGLYDIICQIVIYREKLGKHPNFLQKYVNEERDKKEGYYTKFYLLIKENLLNENEAVAEVDYLTEQYSSLIGTCEDTGNWDSFPFKNREVIYYK